MYSVRLVCEGPTDLEVFRAVLDAHLDGADYGLSMLQPNGALYGGSAGPHGGGWKGVRGWCQEVAAQGGVQAIGALSFDTDLLVIHVDGDIAGEKEHQVTQPCPPPAATVLAVERLVCDWLGVASLPDRVVLWVPSMATEAWVLRSLFHGLPESQSCLAPQAPPDCVECLADPATVLLGRLPKLVKRKQGELKKIRIAYVAARAKLAASWSDLTGQLWSAQRLQQGLNRWVPTP
ncbi:MAG: hypothetical protein HYV63_08260 [Candidatus Schekmanbacteria bacterium]|nr:hypothetical protein [Candidatus Schekmanbacteria bacterium]